MRAFLRLVRRDERLLQIACVSLRQIRPYNTVYGAVQSIFLHSIPEMRAFVVIVFAANTPSCFRSLSRQANIHLPIGNIGVDIYAICFHFSPPQKR